MIRRQFDDNSKLWFWTYVGKCFLLLVLVVCLAFGSNIYRAIANLPQVQKRLCCMCSIVLSFICTAASRLLFSNSALVEKIFLAHKNTCELALIPELNESFRSILLFLFDSPNQRVRKTISKSRIVMSWNHAIWRVNTFLKDSFMWGG